MGLAVMGTNIPSPLYGVYAMEWGFSSGTLTLIFAIYCLVLIASLLIFGRFSDEVGRRRVVLAGLVVISLGSLLFALAQDVAWLLAARIVQGIAVGMLSGAAAAALAELQPEGDRRAAAFTATVALTGGSAVGPVFGGLLAQYAPYPLRLAYVTDLVLLGIVILGIWAVMPETVTPKAKALLRPRRPRVPADILYPFVVGSGVCFVGWAIAGLFIALIPSYAASLLDVDNLVIGGASVSVMLGSACAVQVLLRKLSSHRAMALGMAALTGGLAAMVVAVPAGSVLLLLAAALLGGAGLGLSFMGGLGLVGRVAPSESRAEVLSACYVIIYLGESIPVLGVGYGADWIGLYPAVVAFAAVIGSLGLLTVLFAARPRVR